MIWTRSDCTGRMDTHSLIHNVETIMATLMLDYKDAMDD